MAQYNSAHTGAQIDEAVQAVRDNETKWTNAPISMESADGVAYAATVPWITKLSPGARFTAIPNKLSTNVGPTLNVNGLGAKSIRCLTGYNTDEVHAGASAEWISPNKPVDLMYNGDVWVAMGVQRTSASAIVGTIEVEQGGTGANNPEGARANLGAVGLPVANDAVNHGAAGQLAFSDGAGGIKWGNVTYDELEKKINGQNDHTANLSNTGFTRPNGSQSPSENGRRTDKISTDGVTKIFGNIGLYSECMAIAFYDANNNHLADIGVLGSALLTNGENYGEGTFEIDLTNEKYAGASYFVVSSYRSQNADHAYYYTQPTDFSADYCKYTKAEETTDGQRYRIGSSAIAFFGDSITAGGFPELIASITGAKVTNHGIGGATLAAGTDASANIVELVNAYAGNDDIICISGGLNDKYKSVPLGTLTAGYSDELDATTVMGALETIFRKLLTNHTAARLCYVITHKAASTETNSNSLGLTFADYHDAIVRVLEKYSIPFYDAFMDSGLITNTSAPWGETASELYTTNADATHPNEAGYLKYYVYQIINLLENGVGSSKQVSEKTLINDVLAALPVYHGEVEDV